MIHGTTGGYSNHKCRCDECRLAWNEYCKKNKAKRRATTRLNGAVTGGAAHGTENAYQSGCQCNECKTAHGAIRALAMRLRGDNPKPPEGSPCALCLDTNVRRLVLDHDHVTRKFRGWICDSCNTGLGKLGDDADGLKRAIEYLRRAEGYSATIQGEKP